MIPHPLILSINASAIGIYDASIGIYGDIGYWAGQFPSRIDVNAWVRELQLNRDCCDRRYRESPQTARITAALPGIPEIRRGWSHRSVWWDYTNAFKADVIAVFGSSAVTHIGGDTSARIRLRLRDIYRALRLPLKASVDKIWLKYCKFPSHESLSVKILV